MRQPAEDHRRVPGASASLADVARHAGVSLSTASRALSGINVRASSRSRVLLAAAELGYQVNLTAQATARGTSNLIAVVVDDLRNQHTSALVRGIVQSAASRNVLVAVLCGDAQPGGLRAAVRTARELRVRAMIVTPDRASPSVRDALVVELEAYQKSGGRLVRVGSTHLGEVECTYDERGAAAAMAGELVHLGYRRPLILSGLDTAGLIDERARGFIDGFELSGIAEKYLGLVRASPDRAGAQAVLDEVGPARLVSRADVVLCPDDTMASATYAWLRRHGLRAGLDVGVVGFGGHETSTALRPRLTTIEVPSEHIGRAAADMALGNGPVAPVAHPLRLRVRESTPWRTGRYTADPNARRVGDLAVAPSRTGIVSALISGPANHVVDETLASLRAAAAADGFRLVVVTDSQHGSEDQTELVKRVRGGSDGIFLWAPMMPIAALDALIPAVQPIVVLDRAGAMPAAQVGVDYAEGVQTLLEHLYALGHRHLAYLMGPEWSDAQGERTRGIRMFASTHPGVRIEQVPCGSGVDDGYSAWANVRDSGATAVVAFNDLAAIGLLGRLQHEGVAVPSELSVTGMDDVAVARFATPPLTTVAMPLEEVGRAAWRAMRAQLEGGPAEASRSFEPTLVVRGTTGPPPTR